MAITFHVITSFSWHFMSVIFRVITFFSTVFHVSHFSGAVFHVAAGRLNATAAETR